MIEYIIPIIIFIIAAIIIFKVARTLAKALFMIIGLAILILLVFGVVIALDAKDFKESFSATPSLYLLESTTGDISAGFSAIMQEDVESSLDIVRDSALNTYRASYAKGDYDAIKGNNYKVFIVKEGYFDSVNSIDLGDIVLEKEEFFSLMGSETPIDDFVSKRVYDEGESSSFKNYIMNTLDVSSDTEFKGKLFAMAFFAVIQKEGPLKMVYAIRSGEIEAQPRSVFFDLVKGGPESMIDGMMGNLKEVDIDGNSG